MKAQSAQFESFLQQFITALWKHLCKRGWQKKYIQHISDEPSLAALEKYKRITRIVRESAPGIKLIDAIGPCEFGDVIEHPVPIENHYDQLLKQTGRSKKDVWVYYCCGPTGRWPNHFIDYWLLRVRIMTWICFQKQIPGFLHWGYNYWGTFNKENLYNPKNVHNPWDDPSTLRHPPGDPCMVYPPPTSDLKQCGVIGSIRWEIVRKAREDYAYLDLTRQVANKGNREALAILKEVASKIVPDWTSHIRDHTELEKIRKRMGKLLSS